MSKPDLQYVMYDKKTLLVRFKGKRRTFSGDESRIMNILSSCLKYKENPTEELAQEVIGFLSPIEGFKYSNEFVRDTETDELYLKNTTVPLPEELADVIRLYEDQEIPTTALINFWKLCVSNPNKVAREGFYKYVRDFGIVITDAGYVILYKAMNVKRGAKEKPKAPTDKKLSSYVSDNYLKIKGMKKAPKNYHVFIISGIDEEKQEIYTRYGLSKHTGVQPALLDSNEEEVAEDLGVLEELYEEIVEKGKELEVSTPDINVYGPSHSGSHGMKATLGTPVTMPREDCDPDINKACSYGLHVGSHKYVSNFGTSMDAILAVLVNPKDVVALPKYDHSKIRVCRYFPYAEIIRSDGGEWEELEHGHFEEDFIDYEIEEINNELEGLSKKKDASSEERKIDLERRLVVLNNSLDS